MSVDLLLNLLGCGIFFVTDIRISKNSAANRCTVKSVIGPTSMKLYEKGEKQPPENESREIS